MADPTIDPALIKQGAGLAGALLSIRFIPGSLPARLTMAAGGGVFSFLAAPPASAWLGAAGAEGVIGFFIGLFGMAIIAKVFEMIHALDAAQMARDLWAAITKRLGG